MHKLILALACLLGILAGVAHAQQQLEIIKLNYSTVDQVLPQLKPFVEPGGALSGMNNQLFLRASPGNRQQIKDILATIDRPARRLMISVRQDADMSGSARGAEVSGNVGSNRVRIIGQGSNSPRGLTVETRQGENVVRGQVYDSRSAGSDRVSQQVQVVEGGKAFINVGTSVPVPLRQVVLTPNGAIVSDSVVYRDIGTGFYAEPRLSGDRVTLEISPTHDTPANLGPGSANVQRISTTVSARLGEWMEIGGVNQEAGSSQDDSTRYSTRGVQSARRVMLKVEELP
jgi:hypothetical protein